MFSDFLRVVYKLVAKKFVYCVVFFLVVISWTYRKCPLYFVRSDWSMARFRWVFLLFFLFRIFIVNFFFSYCRQDFKIKNHAVYAKYLSVSLKQKPLSFEPCGSYALILILNFLSPYEFKIERIYFRYFHACVFVWTHNILNFSLFRKFW